MISVRGAFAYYPGKEQKSSGNVRKGEKRVQSVGIRNSNLCRKSYQKIRIGAYTWKSHTGKRIFDGNDQYALYHGAYLCRNDKTFIHARGSAADRLHEMTE